MTTYLTIRLDDGTEDVREYDGEPIALTLRS